jgi:hypothetical protein
MRRRASRLVIAAMTDRTSRQPPGERTSDGESNGRERVSEVPLRPRAGANRLDGTVGPRGDAAYAPLRRRRSSRSRRKRGDANLGNCGPRSGRARLALHPLIDALGAHRADRLYATLLSVSAAYPRRTGSYRAETGAARHRAVVAARALQRRIFEARPRKSSWRSLLSPYSPPSPDARRPAGCSTKTLARAVARWRSGLCPSRCNARWGTDSTPACTSIATGSVAEI